MLHKTFVTQSKLTLLALTGQDSERQGVEARMTLLGKPADRGDGRLVSQSNHLFWSLDARFFLIKSGREERKREKYMRNYNQRTEGRGRDSEEVK